MKALTQLRRRFTRSDGRAAKPTTGPSAAAAKSAVGKAAAGKSGDQPAESWRPRAALAGVVAACVGVAAVAVTGAGNASPGLKFVQSGHYIYNSTLGTLFHIDGGTKNVNAQAPLPGAGPSTVVVQTDKSGYVLAPGRSFEFGKSDLKVADPLVVPVTELPVGLEAAGVAFAVYRDSGRIVRFGDHQLVESVDGKLGDPVVTPAGTLWVHRKDSGQLCQLPLQADRLTCLAKVSTGHTGKLTVVGEQAVFVDTTARAMRAVSSEGLGRTVPLDGLDITATSLVAPNDVAGRVAIVNPERNQVHLVDPAPLTGDKEAREPVTKRLRPGRYERVASSGAGLALIDEQTSTLVTLDRDGQQKDLQRIPAPSAGAKVRPDSGPTLFRGADARLYVDSEAGEHVMVVDEGGDVTPVPAVGPKPAKDDPSVTPPPQPTTPPTTTPTNRPSQPTRPPSTPPSQPPRPQPTQPTEPTQPTQPPRTQETNRPDDPPPPPRRPQNPRPTGRPSQPPPTTERPPDPPRSPVEPPRSPANPPTPKPTTPKPTTPKPTTPKPTVQAGRPGAPGSVTGKAGDSSVAVSWRPAAANGAAISRYVVTWSGGTRTVAGTAGRVDVTGLQNGTGYVFTVRAVNRVGNGPGVSTARLTPGAAAEAPQGLNPNPGAGRIALSWQRPDLNGGEFLRYQVDLSGGGTSTSKNVSGTSTSWTGLKNGTRYQLTVRAITRGPDGKTLTGRAASTTSTPVADPAPPKPKAKIVVSRGAETDYPNCGSTCAFIRIEATGLLPNTRYDFDPWTTDWGNFNPGAELTTDANGSIIIDDQFPCGAHGQDVWVVVSRPGFNERSNSVRWPDA